MKAVPGGAGHTFHWPTAPESFMELESLVLLVIAGTPTVVAWIHLWLRRAPLRAKVAWTVPVAVPLLGPILYAALFAGVPSEQRDDLRGQENNNVMQATYTDHIDHP